MMKQPFGIHWFRRDLRIAGNPALRWNWEQSQGRVLGLFCFDSKFLSRNDFSHNRFAFFIETLKSLKNEFEKGGGDLLVIDEAPDEALKKILSQLKPQFISFNQDYEPFARARDENIIKIIKSNSDCQLYTSRDHLLIEPHEILKDDKNFYQVYTPFSKKWFTHFNTKEVQDRVADQSKSFKYLEKLSKNEHDTRMFKIKWKDVFKKTPLFVDACKKFEDKNNEHVTIKIPKAGSLAAFEKLKEFKKKVDSYTLNRDFPAIEGTSQLSIYFKNGSLTTGQVIAYLKLGKTGLTQYLKEIIWREFYYSILWHCPRVENEAFIEKYNGIKWKNNKQWFDKWCEGKTGYPIVDAGMRQLNQTGWMHNRVRMIVASFLTKDLHIDWRWGEKYFMKMLLDGDLAPNNGGWQWAASTGCDPQPYFRIFNPTLQSKKFDPKGNYIRQYVKELKNVEDDEIHDPKDPIVIHADQKDITLKLYKT